MGVNERSGHGGKSRSSQPIHKDAQKLHSAVWQNNLAAVESLLAEGVSPDSIDAEAGWSPLHKALFWGRLQAASLLIAAGAHTSTQDHEAKTPLQMVSRELSIAHKQASQGEVYTWGNGANYQLGSGAEGLQETPARLETLHELNVKQVSAAKFHSMALTKDGKLYSWGFGRGGRLGQGDFLIHSGEAAVILPQQVSFFSKRKVIQIAASKHHSAAITSTGELFTWGSNRDGRLGYQQVDTQPTPRKVTAFTRMKVVAVALANRHSVAVLDNGSLYSWGSNNQGQLGYGTSDPASMSQPRMIEAMKGKHVSRVAAAKRHTLVLTSEGNVYQWGHGVVTPRRVVLAGRRDVSRLNSEQGKGWEIVFHKGQTEVSRPTAVKIAAGAAHSSVVTQDGIVMSWRSMDPTLTPQEVGDGLAGRRVVSISAGKYRTAAVTAEGEVFMWEGWSKAAEAQNKGIRNPIALGSSPPQGVPAEWDLPKSAKHRRSGKAKTFQVINPQRIDGLVRVSEVAVGEKHSIALSTWDSAPIPFRNLTPQPDPPVDSNTDQQKPDDLSLSGQVTPTRALLSPANSSAAQVLGSGSFSQGIWTGINSSEYWEEIAQVVKQNQPELAFPDPFFMRLDEDVEKVDDNTVDSNVPSLQRLCEICVAVHMVEPRTVLQILEFADAAGAESLKLHCIGVTLSNLDLILLEAAAQFAQLMPHLVEELEDLWCQHIPRHICPAPSGEVDWRSQMQSLETLSSSMTLADDSLERTFKNPEEEAEAAERLRQERSVRKKLQQIEILEDRAQKGFLDGQQQAKVSLRPVLQAALHALQKRQPLRDIKQILADAQASVTITLSQNPLQNPTAPQKGLPLTQTSVDAVNSKTLDAAPSDKKKKSRRKSGLNESSLPETSESHLTIDGGLQGTSNVGSASHQSSSRTSVSSYRPQSQQGTRLALEPMIPKTIGFSVTSPASEHPPNLHPNTPLGKVQTGFRVAAPRPMPQGPEATPAKHSGDDQKSSLGLSGSKIPATHSKAAEKFQEHHNFKEVPELLSSAKKPNKRRGGLSMFLAGDLDSPEKTAKQIHASTAQTPVPAKPGISWGQGIQTPMQHSLRDIWSQQSQESITNFSVESRPTTAQKTPASAQKSSEEGKGSNSSWPLATPRQTSGKPAANPSTDPPPPVSGISIALGDLVKRSAPQPIEPSSKSQGGQASSEKRGPAWGGVMMGASPSRLADIQAEEELKREHSGRSWGALGTSPSTQRANAFAAWNQGKSVDGFGGSPGTVLPAGTSPSTRRSYLPPQAPPSKWYIKEEPEIVALRSIQTEEVALKELTEFMNANQEAERLAEEEKKNVARKKRKPRVRKPKKGSESGARQDSQNDQNQGGQPRRKSEGREVMDRPESSSEKRQHHPPRRKSDGVSESQGNVRHRYRGPRRPGSSSGTQAAAHANSSEPQEQNVEGQASTRQSQNGPRRPRRSQRSSTPDSQKPAGHSQDPPPGLMPDAAGLQPRHKP